MINHREILRLESLGLNNTQIAASCECARSTVIEVKQRAKAKGLRYPLPEEMTDRELASAVSIVRKTTVPDAGLRSGASGDAEEQRDAEPAVARVL